MQKEMKYQASCATQIGGQGYEFTLSRRKMQKDLYKNGARFDELQEPPTEGNMNPFWREAFISHSSKKQHPQQQNIRNTIPFILSSSPK